MKRRGERAKRKCLPSNPIILKYAFAREGEEAEGNPTVAAWASFDQKISCTYCHKSHPSVHCNVIINVKARKSLLLKQGRCFICLKKTNICKAPQDVSNVKGKIIVQAFANKIPLCWEIPKMIQR